MLDDETPLETAIHIVRQKAYPPPSRMNAILYMVEKFEPVCIPVFEEVLYDTTEDADVRSAAALALGKTGGDRALVVLKEMAQHEDATIKNYSLQALGLTGREEAVPVLMDALQDENNTVFAAAAEALGKIGKPVVPYLINLLDNSPADDARCIAAWQLGLLQYRDAVPSLMKSVRDEKNTEVKALAIWALGEIGYGPQEVIDTLKLAREEKDPAINQRAEMAIKKIARHVN